MLVWSVAIAIGGSWLGCRLAEWLDASYAGAIATMLGAVFAVAFLLAPHRGLLSQAARRRRQQREFAVAMLLVHLENHEGTEAAEIESRISSLPHHLRWTAQHVALVAEQAQRKGFVNRIGEQLALTNAGRERARAVLSRPKQ
jgi:manganese/zinc/iron transport system permease protein